ncbi:glycosyltransferase family 2 protein [uncultured Psychroserpens sp.]|uniref:glycosyltransferase family 2 protein n=1 Tax=uncultured Psychroserpens sp. TaxID=255436 RepID=UPI002614F729|nr:glycosyltransferase family 2 protein [uncultured Psychroserpens sp.]
MRKFKNVFAKLFRALFGKTPSDFKNIPIFINNYNRLPTILKLIEALEKRGYTNIHILDNQSTYPPLLEYYKNTPYKVHFLEKNFGSKAFWKSGLWLKFVTSYYVYTDPDVVPIEDCPDDFLEYFYSLLKKYPKAHKVGFSLKIDDLPDTYINKEKVIEWESRYHKETIEDNVFIAAIDTTFALYRPFSKLGQRDHRTLTLRTGIPYQARHLPWYIDNENLDDEELFYINSIETRTGWSRQNK